MLTKAAMHVFVREIRRAAAKLARYDEADTVSMLLLALVDIAYAHPDQDGMFDAFIKILNSARDRAELARAESRAS